jgi:hypothetical protein
VSWNELSLDKIHLQIGACCTNWASIEMMVREIILVLSAHHNQMYHDYAARQPLHILLRNMDLREMTEAAKAIALVSIGDSDLFHRMSRDMNLISNEMRNKRNRLIHDD